MRLTHSLQIINNITLDTLRNKIKVTVAEAPQYLSKLKEQNKKTLYEKLVGLNKWYVKIIGLDEVKLYQDKVTSLQEKLLATQEKRREVGLQLADVRQKSLELQDQIHKVKRQEDLAKFLDLMKQETEILQLETAISRTFQDYDQAERELFTAFTNAIRDSHEKQRAQLEYTKYFGIILSITGSFLAFVYTSLKKQDLKKFIEQKLINNASAEPVILNLVQANEKTIKEVIKNRETLNQVVKVLAAQGKVDGHHIMHSQGTNSVNTIPLQPDNDLPVTIIKVTLGLCVAVILMKLVS